KNAKKLRYGQGAAFYGLYAWIAVKRGKIDDAINVLLRATKKMENDTLKRNIEILQNNKPKTAERYYLQVMKDTSEQCETLFHIALSYCTAGLYDTAINLLNDVWSMLGSQEGRFVVPYIAHCYYRKND
ncbi:MAG: tetratricopeptide repeat protein, partial [Prevotella sp.]